MPDRERIREEVQQDIAKQDAYNIGYESAMAGIYRDLNPYITERILRTKWFEGYDACKAKQEQSNQSTERI